MERNEADTISSKVEHLEAELVAMRTKLDQEVEQRHAQGRNMDVRILVSRDGTPRTVSVFLFNVESI